MIRVQQQPFDLASELHSLRATAKNAGATNIFIGTVRAAGDTGDIDAMTLEHYPGMTETALADIEAEARRRWPLSACLIVHRYGRLVPGEDIVLVITMAAHRAAAIEATGFLIDWLKTKAPFWKLEEGQGVRHWVEAKGSDDEAAERWTKP